MKKWYDEEYEFTVEVTEYIRESGDMIMVTSFDGEDPNGFLGFKEFEVIPTLWDEANPCQIYVMSLK